MDKKYLIKFKDGVIRGPFSESEIDDMIYDNVLAGEEELREYPDGEWIGIAKLEHFYDVFMGAFEIEKNIKTSDKETFVDSPTRTNIKKQNKETEKTTIQDKKKIKDKKVVGYFEVFFLNKLQKLLVFIRVTVSRIHNHGL